MNYERRVFLDYWHSSLENESVNERREFPTNFFPLIKSHRCIVNESS